MRLRMLWDMSVNSDDELGIPMASRCMCGCLSKPIVHEVSNVWEFAGVSGAQACEAVKLDVDLVTSCGDTLSRNHDTQT